MYVKLSSGNGIYDSADFFSYMLVKYRPQPNKHSGPVCFLSLSFNLIAHLPFPVSIHVAFDATVIFALFFFTLSL